ncbi:MAG: response regulator transcription factor [Anaerolineales bacterium]|jgi:DNA-binding response OmpR family regulator
MQETRLKDRRILVVDDEERMVRFIRLNLEHDGFRVIEAFNGSQAIEKVRNSLPDLILLDVMMPDIDGFEVLRIIREVSTVPVIMLTAKGEEDDRVRGLELGADDYITKPFSPRELASRVRAVLRRTETAGGSTHGLIEVDDRLKLDFDRREVWVEGKLVKLRPTEYRLLYHLVQNAGWVISHDQLLAKVWGYEYRDEPHYVRLYINYLRKKLEEDPSNPKYILTERGVGYRFVDFRRKKEREAKEEAQSEDSEKGTS